MWRKTKKKYCHQKNTNKWGCFTGKSCGGKPRKYSCHQKKTNKWVFSLANRVAENQEKNLATKKNTNKWGYFTGKSCGGKPRKDSCHQKKTQTFELFHWQILWRNGEFQGKQKQKKCMGFLFPLPLARSLPQKQLKFLGISKSPGSPVSNNATNGMN